MMLRILMGTMRVLRWLDPCGRRSDGMGISFLPFCPSCSDSPSIGTCGGDVIELPSLQPYFDSFPGEYQVREAGRHVAYQLLIVKHWQGVYHHGNHLPFDHGRGHLCCQVSPLLSILFKGLTFLLNHVLQLSAIGSHIGIVLILPKEGSN